VVEMFKVGGLEIILFNMFLKKDFIPVFIR
jgi:hypothetical protein